MLIVQNLCNHLDDKEIKWFAEKHKYKMGSCICQGWNVVRKVKIDNSKYNHLRKRIQSSQKKSVKQTDIPRLSDTAKTYRYQEYMQKQ